MKAIMWPEIDNDGLMSSYVLKVLTVMGKWSMRMTNLVEILDSCKSDRVAELPGCLVLGSVLCCVQTGCSICHVYTAHI